jgi:hypothetical protein
MQHVAALTREENGPAVVADGQVGGVAAVVVRAVVAVVEARVELRGQVELGVVDHHLPRWGNEEITDHSFFS